MAFITAIRSGDNMRLDFLLRKCFDSDHVSAAAFAFAPKQPHPPFAAAMHRADEHHAVIALKDTIPLAHPFGAAPIGVEDGDIAPDLLGSRREKLDANGDFL